MPFIISIFRRRSIRFIVVMAVVVLAGGAVARVMRAQNPAVTVTVDAAANRRPISPLIYGVAVATPAQLADLNAPLHRLGGNNTSRYNWQLNAYNRGSDWYFESIGEASSVAGESGDTFIANTRAGGAEPMVTVPMLDWVARLGANRARLASFSIAKYGPQTGNDAQWFPDAGNGVRTTGGYVTGNDPNDASVRVDPAFQQAWVQHLVGKWGGASSGGLRYYVLDNEPSGWHLTHRDVHPVGSTMDEVRARFIDHATAVKAVDPNARIVGPEEWGWVGYLFSGYDQQWANANGWGGAYPDRTAHGGWEYLPWWLDQLRAASAAAGKSLLDVFSVHYYPQGGEFSTNVSSSMQLLRNRSTRSLWDPNYVDESWIKDRIQLIPRLRNWVNTYYAPGTPIAITEYNWGAEAYISGALAQADVFGIFGREGLDMGARWRTPAPSTPTYKAMKMYRNYDGNKSAFGDVSVSASGPNPDDVAVFAAERTSDGALTVMVLNKYLSGTTPVTLNLANFASAGVAQRWQLTAANTIERLSDLAFSGTSASDGLPAQSVTLFVFPAGTPAPNQAPAAAGSATPTSGVAPLTVAFDGSTSSDPDGSIVSYAWSFGDGASGSGALVSHRYAASGTYSASLTVTDDRGATGVRTFGITVTPDSNVINGPSGLRGSASGGTVQLSWTDNASNETAFSIERKPSNQKTWNRVGTVGANVTAYSERPGRGNYDYRVQAVNSSTGRSSAYSNQIQLRVR